MAKKSGEPVETKWVNAEIDKKLGHNWLGISVDKKNHIIYPGICLNCSISGSDKDAQLKCDRRSMRK